MSDFFLQNMFFFQHTLICIIREYSKFINLFKVSLSKIRETGFAHEKNVSEKVGFHFRIISNLSSRDDQICLHNKMLHPYHYESYFL